ncbi:MAG: T9SS type A sorting domain-containing protein [Bacteroidota bacterium]
MRKALPFLFLLVTGPLMLSAQARLAIDSLYTNLPNDTLFFNLGTGDSIIEYTLRIENVGNGSHSGPVDIRCYYNGDTTLWRKDEFITNNFEVGQTTIVSFKDTVVSGDARYKGGNNILVIWPHSDASSVQAPDTSDVDVYINQLVSVVDPTLFFARVKVGPNPVQGTLYLQYPKDQHKLEYVRIFNSSGQIIRTYDKAVGRIDFDDMPVGLYFLDIQYRDGVGGSYKILVPR